MKNLLNFEKTFYAFSINFGKFRKTLKILKIFKKFDKLLIKILKCFCKEYRRVKVILENFLRMLNNFYIDLIKFNNILRKFWEILKNPKKLGLSQEQPVLIDVFPLVDYILLVKALAAALVTVLSVAYCKEDCNR